MIIEIRKAGFTNKGAELMLLAVLKILRAKFPSAKFVMAVHPVSSPYHKRVQLGLYQKLHVYRAGFQWGNLLKLCPKFFRDLFGIVLTEELDVIIDIAGFSYSDQWQSRNLNDLAQLSLKAKKLGILHILMPQAFGPFESPESIKAMQIALSHTDLIFAREDISYQNLLNLNPSRTSHIHVAPDFTNLLMGEAPDYFDSDTCKICIVPNYRMVDKVSSAKSAAYLPFLVNCVNFFLERNQKPFFLIHEGENDEKLAKSVEEHTNQSIPILIEKDPLKIKGVLGASEAVIASRFHAIVSGLSQSVPTLGTSWSHKYEQLYKDYNFEEGILDVLDDLETLHMKLSMLLNSHSKEEIKAKLSFRSEALKLQSHDMWSTTIDLMSSNYKK